MTDTVVAGTTGATGTEIALPHSWFRNQSTKTMCCLKGSVAMGREVLHAGKKAYWGISEFVSLMQTAM
jgi:hypothetical protein